MWPIKRLLKVLNLNIMSKGRIAVVALYISYFALPIVAFYVNSVFRVALALIIVFSFLQNVENKAAKILPLYLISFLTAGLQNAISGGLSFTTIYHFFNLYVLSLIGFFILEYHHVRPSYLLSKTCLALLSITCITTTIGNIIFPGASRILAGVGDQVDLYNQYMRFNIGGFDFVYMMVISLPLAIGLARLTSNKILGYILVFLIFAVVVETGYGFATLMLLVSVLLLFGSDVKSQKTVRTFVAVLVILMILSQSVLPYVLSYLATLIPNEDVATRFNDLSLMLSGNVIEDGNDIEQRSTQYQRSIDGFLNSSLLGTWDNNTGGHSFLLDTLCRFGLLGLALFIIMMIRAYKLYVKPFVNEPFYGYLLFSFVLYAISLIVNPQPNILVISLIFPVFVSFYRSKIVR